VADTDILKGYKPKSFPTIDGGQPTYIADELQKISVSLSLIGRVLAALEARIVALGG
jgi:hypothetical protein